MIEEKITFINKKGKSKTIPCKKWDISEVVNIKETGNLSYILLNEIKKACQNNNLNYEEFLDWITGQTCPLVESEGDNKFYCIFPWDFDRWFYYKIKHNVTPKVLD